MTPGVLNLYVTAGDTVRNVLSLTSPGSTPTTPGTAIDLTGCKAEMTIKQLGESDYYLNSSTSTTNGGIITLGGAAGTITIYIPSADTVGLISGQFALRLQFANQDLSTIVAGTVFVQPEVAAWR